MTNNDAAPVTHDAIRPLGGGQVRGFNRYWTKRAVALLRRVAQNPHIQQKRDDWGGLDANGHGAACANQVLIDLLDNVRNQPGQAAQRRLLNQILPVSTDEIIGWNDSQMLTFPQIAAKIEQAAGDQLYAD